MAQDVPLNPSFEDADGGDPRLPDIWVQMSGSTAVDIADFGDQSGEETFETGWFVGDFLAVFAPGDIEAAVFGTAGGSEQFEPFDSWSGVAGYFFVLPQTEAAVFGAEAFESFETGWFVGDFLEEFDVGDIEAALFDDGNGGDEEFEAFEGGWDGNEDFSATMPATEAALFGPNDDDFEDFESCLAPNPFTVDMAANNLITAAAHTLSDGDKFTCELVLTQNAFGALPKGLQPETVYRAIVIDPSTLKASLDGSTPIDIQDQGAGVFVVVGDKELLWTTFLDI